MIIYEWVIALAFHLNLSLLFMVGIVPLTGLVSRLPISFDGIGMVEGSLIALMSLAGVMPAESVAFAIIARIVHTLAWSPCWLSYTFQTKKLRSLRTARAQGKDVDTSLRG